MEDESVSFAHERLRKTMELRDNTGLEELLSFVASSLVSCADEEELVELDEMLVGTIPNARESYLVTLIQIRSEVKAYVDHREAERREQRQPMAAADQSLAANGNEEGAVKGGADAPPSVLVELYPELHLDFISYLYHQEWRLDLQLAVEWGLDKREEKVEGLLKRQMLWVKEQDDEREQAKKMREVVIERFALQEIREPNNRPPPPPPKHSEAAPAPHRYMDGRAIRTKDKYAVDPSTIQPEWDGGSRGKIKGKGKRGAGGVKIA